MKLIAVFLFILFQIGLSAQNFSDLSGPYLGQDPPELEPRLFLPGLISTNYTDHCIAFLNQGKVCVFAVSGKGVFYTFEENGKWTQPQRTPWQNENGNTDFMAAPDDRSIYFQSSRLTNTDDVKKESNIWKVQWMGNKWSGAKVLPELANTKDYWELYPTVEPNGTVYFFTWTRQDSRHGDIYHTSYIDESRYLEAERLKYPVNTDYYEVDPCIAPDGSYMLFGSGRPGGFGQFDLYISFKSENGEWGAPIHTGNILNPFSIPTRMSITPDGKYFFFPSKHPTEVYKGEKVESASIKRWGDYDIYWISTDIFKEIKRKYFNKVSAANEVKRKYVENGLEQSIKLLRDVFQDSQQGFYFEISEFLLFCGELISEDKAGEADRFYETLLALLPEKYRLMYGYANTCVMNERVSYALTLFNELWDRFPKQKSDAFFITTFQLRFYKKKEDELKVLRFVTEEFPESPYAFYNLATAYKHYGNDEKSIESCKKALAIDPSMESAKALLKKLSKIKK